MNNTIADLFHMNSRFLRSTHLERDFSDPDSCTGYILTDFTKSCVERLTEGMLAHSTKRAWRLTGDYGTGKSSFALVLAHLFSGYQNEVLGELRASIKIDGLCIDNLNLIPILITGSRAPLKVALQSALRKSLVTVAPEVSKTKFSPLLQRILKVSDKDMPSRVKPGFLQDEWSEIPNITDEEIVEGFIEFSRFIKSESKGSGILLILDELGKFLEFAAMYPERQDIYLLQQLAEASSGRSDTPLFVLGLLHQGFNAYADHLDDISKQEWEKIAGRFEEILFNQPLEQVVHLLSSALGIQVEDVPAARQREATSQMRYALKHGWYGPVPLRDAFLAEAVKLFPLDPLAVPVIVRTMHRFGQNERSLFSFLQSSEPFGLQAYASQYPLKNSQLYRIHDFYDYVRANLSHSPNLTGMRTHWNVIDSVISGYVSNDGLELEVLKTVGMLNLLNAHEFLPTEALIVQAVAGTRRIRSGVRDAIATLKYKKRVLYDRGISGGLCLWPHTSVDLDTAYKNAERAVGEIQRVSERIKTYLDRRPIVARRHYIQTGNLRHFEIQYLSASEFIEFKHLLDESVDGTIIIVLCDSLQEYQQTLQKAQTPKFIGYPQLLIAIPPPLEDIVGYLRDLLCWEWVGKNTLELNTDAYARQEVSRQRNAAHTRLENRIADLIDLRGHSGEMKFSWFSEGKPLKLSTGKQLLKHLSDVCDRVFMQAPKIQNELINRHNLSSAASGARLRLITAMLEKESETNLGMIENQRPPEKSMYLSILKRGNIHVKGEKMWYIQEPSADVDLYGVLPALKRIEVLLKSGADNKIRGTELFAALKKPPFGVREGLIPLLLTIYFVAHRQDLAIFEEGTFLREVRGDDFYRLIKAPEYFEIQHSAIEGVRASVFDRLISVLGIQQTSDEQNSRILDVVQPLCNFVVQLPEYVHNTQKLSQETIAVRDRLMSAIEPAPLLFRDLPIACGYPPFDVTALIDDDCVQDFAEQLKMYLGELKDTYTDLLERLKFTVFEVFDVGNNLQSRGLLQKRAENLRVSVSESQLKALCIRLSDNKLSETKWIESVASFVVSKPPSYWVDSDEYTFQHKLDALASRFKHVESVYFGTGGVSERSTGIRLSITHANGSERAEVMYPQPEDREKLVNIQKQIQGLLRQHGRLGLAAVAHVVWDELNESAEEIE